jgi:hypothetical protein
MALWTGNAGSCPFYLFVLRHFVADLSRQSCIFVMQSPYSPNLGYTA